MTNIMDLPVLVFTLSLITLWIAARIGSFLQMKYKTGESYDHEDFSLILGATLTLLGLILGFSFSMAINRYDQRKNYEEAEANAIGTEYVRADLLPGDDAAKVRALLSQYLDQRILFYQIRNWQQRQQIDRRTTQLQDTLWSAARLPAVTQQTAVVALAVSGMNDVLNSEGYTQAAWWNRIPVEAWVLMACIAIAANLLLGFGMRRKGKAGFLLLVLPLIISISFCLIADIDSPRGGFVRVRPQNLLSLAHSLHP